MSRSGDAGAWGVPASYRDAFERRRRISPRSRLAVLRAMGVEPGMPPPGEPVVRVVPVGSAPPLAGELRLEDGTRVGPVDALPADLPIGYHHLEDVLLLVAPPRCHLPRGLRAWGWVAQLYAARSAGSWGHGDLADLRMLGTMARRQGAGFVAASPTWAPNPGVADPEASPYFPSTRRFASPLYLRLEEIPGADAAGPELVRLAAAGRALNASPRIDRAAVAELKLRAADLVWRATGSASVPETFRTALGPSLRRWATFATLSEALGADWRRWAAAYRDPVGPAVARFAKVTAERIAFHEWLQWRLDRQRAAAGDVIPLVNDLPVASDPAGFDAWEWQALLADGATLGVPADRFSPVGQDWGLPPFVPHRLRAAGYRPFVETVRAGLRHAGGLRLDHVLGLFRQWWVPDGIGPAAGAYVRFPTDELLAVLAIESHRARGMVIGEDLGTVPRGVRPRLARANVLSTRLMYFERRPPAAWPRKALAAITTHDLPTLAGLWEGSDLADLARSGLPVDPDAAARLRARVAAASDGALDDDVATAVLRAHRALASAPPMLVGATLEDALRVAERPNVPGTVAPVRVNWSAALPLPLEELARDPFVARLAEALRR